MRVGGVREQEVGATVHVAEQRVLWVQHVVVIRSNVGIGPPLAVTFW